MNKKRHSPAKLKLFQSLFVLIPIILVNSAFAQTLNTKVNKAAIKTVVPNKKNNGKYILVDSITLKQVSEREYDEAGKTKNGMIYLFYNGHWGIVRKTGQVLISPDTSKYRYIDDKPDSAGNYVAWLYDAQRKNFLGDMVLLNKQYVQVTSRAYNFIMAFEDGYYKPYQIVSSATGDLLFGLLNKNGKEILKPVYDLITVNKKQGLIVTSKHDGKEGLYDLAGKIVLPEEYDRIDRDALEEGKNIVVEKGGLKGVIDKKGKIIIPIKYSTCFYNDYGVNSYYDVEIDDKKGVISLSGKVIINPEYPELYSMMDDGCLLFSCSKDGVNWGWIDLTGKTVLPLIYKNVVSCPGKEGLSQAQMADSAYVYVNKAGQTMFGKKYKFASSFSNGIAYVKEKEKFGMINASGAYVVQPAYDEISDVYDGEGSHEMYAVRKEGKWGFMNNSGKLIVPILYDGPREETTQFYLSEGLIPVSLNKKWGYIDKSGKTMISFTYDAAGSFSDGTAEVVMGNETFYINKEGVRKK